jgi:hypothetical protein
VLDRKSSVVQNSLACGAQLSRLLALVLEERNRFIFREAVLLILFSAWMKEKFQRVNDSICDITKATNVLHIATTRDKIFTVVSCFIGSYKIEILTNKYSYYPHIKVTQISIFIFKFRGGNIVHYYTFQINQSTRCNNF